MDKNIKKAQGRLRRKLRGRKKIEGTSERPRLSIYRSNVHWYAQIIDDQSQKTVAAASTLSLKELKSKSNADAAKAVGTAIAEKAKAAGVSSVVFDKNGFLYHGRVKILADAAREAGLKF